MEASKRAKAAAAAEQSRRAKHYRGPLFTAAGVGPVLHTGGCWCGGKFGHDWAGKAEGDPHPRDWPGKVNGHGYR